MKIVLRRGTPADAQACGRIDYEAFRAVAESHKFPPDFPSVDAATATVTMMLSHPGFYSVVAELDGKIVGSNFLDERSIVGGIGPISVAPEVQNNTIGRQLMLDVLKRGTDRKLPAIRLVQSAYHNRSLCLYTKLGFDTRAPLSLMTGSPLGRRLAGYDVRTAREADLDACNQLCLRVHGHDRAGELLDAIRNRTAMVVERLGRITGYAGAIALFSHAVAETDDDLKALIAAAPAFGGPGFLVPTCNGELMRWCLGNGFRLVQQMTLMTIGLYNEPSGAYLPSVLF